MSVERALTVWIAAVVVAGFISAAVEDPAERSPQRWEDIKTLQESERDSSPTTTQVIEVEPFRPDLTMPTLAPLTIPPGLESPPSIVVPTPSTVVVVPTLPLLPDELEGVTANGTG